MRMLNGPSGILLENWDVVGLSEWEEDRSELLDKIEVKRILESHGVSQRRSSK